jgi:hypothetical protein
MDHANDSSFHHYYVWLSLAPCPINSNLVLLVINHLLMMSLSCKVLFHDQNTVSY